MSVVEIPPCLSAADVLERARRVQRWRRAVWKGPESAAVAIAPPPKVMPAPVPVQAAAPPAVTIPVPAAVIAARKRMRATCAAVPGSVAEIIAIAAAWFHLTPAEIRSDRRHAPLVLARQVGAYVAFRQTTRSTPEIGRTFHRDHTTILHAKRNIEVALADGNLEIAAAVKEITAEVKRRAALRLPPPEEQDNPASTRQRPWSAAEQTKLIRLYMTEKRTPRHIARVLRRTKSSVVSALRRYHLLNGSKPGPRT